MDAAVDALLALGVEGTTIEAIADRSGVAKSTIYRHFGSREALLVDAVRSCVVEVPTPDTGSLADDLADLFARYDEPDNQATQRAAPAPARRSPPRPADVRRRRRRCSPSASARCAPSCGWPSTEARSTPTSTSTSRVAMLIGPLTYRRMVQHTEIDRGLHRHRPPRRHRRPAVHRGRASRLTRGRLRSVRGGRDAHRGDQLVDHLAERHRHR